MTDVDVDSILREVRARRRTLRRALTERPDDPDRLLDALLELDDAERLALDLYGAEPFTAGGSLR